MAAIQTPPGATALPVREGAHIELGRVGVDELVGKLNADMYKHAYERGMNFSTYLDAITTQPAGGPEMIEIADQSDPRNWGPYPSGRTFKRRKSAFERQLEVRDIVVKADIPAGIPAHTVARFYTGDNPDSLVLFPEFISRTIRAVALQPNILDAVVGMTTGITGSDLYRAFYLTDDADSRTLRRVSQGAEIPTATLTGGDHTITLKKYGRRLLGTYEVFRHMAIDRFAFHLMQIGQQAMIDKAATAIDIAINGDGNTSTAATTVTLSSVDAAAGGKVTGKGWLGFGIKFNEPYKATTIVAEKTRIVELMLANVGSANLTMAQLAAVMQQNSGVNQLDFPEPIFGAVRVYGRDLAALSNKVLALDRNNAIEMITELGTSITETDKIISRQFNEIVVSEVVGFAVLTVGGNASKILDLAA